MTARMRAISQRAWYAGGATFSGKTLADWRRQPLTGAVGYVVYFREKTEQGKNYRELLSGSDWYWLDGVYRHSGTSHPDKGSWLPKPDVPGDFVRGEWVSDSEQAAVEAAMWLATEPPA